MNDVLYQIDFILSNPFCGLVIGMLVTVLCQSSSTSTSIFITMVGADLITVRYELKSEFNQLIKINLKIYKYLIRQAIPMIMGANIGTSITSSIVAFANVGDPQEFRNAVSAAVLVAAFNFLTVCILLPLE